MKTGLKYYVRVRGLVCSGLGKVHLLCLRGDEDIRGVSKYFVLLTVLLYVITKINN